MFATDKVWAQVVRGASWLAEDEVLDIDAVFASARAAIMSDSFDMMDEFSCILAIAYGEFTNSPAGSYWGYWTADSIISHGFDLLTEENASDNRELNAAWAEFLMVGSNDC